MIKNYCKYAACTMLWILNPIYLGGCQEKSNEFSFGQEEMLGLLETINTETWSFGEGDETYNLTFNLTQASTEQASRSILNTLSSAYACESRSFVAEAGACIDDTTLPVTGTVTIEKAGNSGDELQMLSISGDMMVIGYDLDNAELSLYQGQDAAFLFDSSDGVSFELFNAEW